MVALPPRARWLVRAGDESRDALREDPQTPAPKVRGVTASMGLHRCPPAGRRRSTPAPSPAVPEPRFDYAPARSLRCVSGWFAEDDHEHGRRNNLARNHLQAGGSCTFDDRFLIDAVLGCRPWTANARREVHDAEAPLRFERIYGVFQNRDWIDHGVVCADDQNRIKPLGQPGLSGRPQHGVNVGEVLPLREACDGFDRLRLDIFGPQLSVCADASCEVDREPATARADLADKGPFADLQGIHDLIGLVPLLAIRPLGLRGGESAKRTERRNACAEDESREQEDAERSGHLAPRTSMLHPPRDW